MGEHNNVSHVKQLKQQTKGSTRSKNTETTKQTESKSHRLFMLLSYGWLEYIIDPHTLGTKLSFPNMLIKCTVNEKIMHMS